MSSTSTLVQTLIKRKSLEVGHGPLVYRTVLKRPVQTKRTSSTSSSSIFCLKKFNSSNSNYNNRINNGYLSILRQLHDDDGAYSYGGMVRSIHTKTSSNYYPTTLLWSTDSIMISTNCSTTCSNRQIQQLPTMVTVRYKNKSSKTNHHAATVDETDERRKKKKDKVSTKKSSNVEIVSNDDSNHIHDDGDDDDDHDDEVHDENILPDPKVVRGQMMKHINSFELYLRTIRGSEVGPEFFDNVYVNAYGDPNTPLQAVAQVVLVSPTRANATCFDPELTKEVVAAIRDTLTLNPFVTDDGVIDIPMPRISMEARIEIVTTVKKRTENYRNRIRSVRRKALDIVKKGVAGKLEHISKDDAYRVQKEIETLSDQMIAKINTAAEKKQQAIMAV